MMKVEGGKIVKRRIVFFLIVHAMIFQGPISAQDSQWRGMNRDGKYMDTGLLKVWPEKGPDLVLMKKGLGEGHSTPVYYEGNIYISGRRDTLDVITRLDLEGNIAWETAFDRSWNQSFPETRATPTIEDGRIYLTGGLGTVVCLDAETGEMIWSVNTHEEYEGEFHRWGMVESILLTEDAVISSPIGGQTAVVALDKSDGSLIWKTKSLGGVRSYASPIMINHGGQDMILVTSDKDLFAVDPSDGHIIWTFDIVTGNSGTRGSRNNTNTPLYHEGMIFTTSGYDVNALMLRLSDDGKQASLVWADGTLDNHHGGVVLVDGYLYGSNWLNNGNGNWVCQDWETGKVMYEEKWINKGSIIYADGLLYLFEEKHGNVGLVRPDPNGFDLISSFKIEEGSGPYWAHMSIYDRKLFVRHGSVLMVYDIAEKD